MNATVWECLSLPTLKPIGLLVTEPGQLDRVIAYKKFGDRPRGVMIRQGEAIARNGRRAARFTWDWIDLRNCGTLDHPMPGWVYGLAAVPLGTDRRDFEFPAPFCAMLPVELEGDRLLADSVRVGAGPTIAEARFTRHYGVIKAEAKADYKRVLPSESLVGQGA